MFSVKWTRVGGLQRRIAGCDRLRARSCGPKWRSDIRRWGIRAYKAYMILYG